MSKQLRTVGGSNAALEQKVGSIETRLVKVVEVLEDNNRKSKQLRTVGGSKCKNA